MRGPIVMAAAGVAAVCVLVGGFLLFTRGAHIRLDGEIQKVRLLTLPDGATIMVLDFRLANPADYEFKVRTIDVLLEDKDGGEHQGAISSEVNARRVFEYYPQLGPKYNGTFSIRESVPPGEAMDRMLAVRFELAEEELEARRSLRIRVEEVDGALSEIVEQRR